MSLISPLHAKYYADRSLQRRVRVVDNVEIARDTFRVRFEFPELARRILPGQFIMLRLADYDDPLLGRPLALYDTVLSDDGLSDDGTVTGLDIVYLVLGKLTSRLAEFRPGQELEVWGPLGNGFQPIATQHLIMVAGGIGQTPFPALARQYLGHREYGEPPVQVQQAPRVTLCYGARSKEFLAGIEDFEGLGVEVHVSTDDGSAGHHGLVTDLLRDQLESNTADVAVVCCGPEPMMEAVSQVAKVAEVPCQVSLETPMACGIGICFSCVAKVCDEQGEWDYKRTCVEGPVFDAEQIVW